jgi:hypothetical protein
MSEWYDSQKKPKSDFRKLLQERVEKDYPRRILTAEEKKRLAKLEAIAERLRRGESVQNRQLQTWLTEEKYALVSKCVIVKDLVYTLLLSENNGQVSGLTGNGIRIKD